MSETFDVAVIGSGFAGSLLAMMAAKTGLSVLLIERGRHPRFSIGESSTPLSNLLLEEIAVRYDLPTLKPLTKWGSWQRTYPGIGCGLKRGFSFFHHHMDGRSPDTQGFDEQMLVAASPHDEVADTHWFRADFDHLLVRQAEQTGVIYRDEFELRRFRDLDDCAELSGLHRGTEASFHARFVVDATGPRGCLHRLLDLGEQSVPGYPGTQAIYTHFSGVKRLQQGDFLRASIDTPYPVDDAAVHHVFDGGWIWVLQFANGLTSAGIGATDAFADQADFSDADAAWRHLIEHIPMLREQFEDARPEHPFVHARQLCFQSARTVGKHFALLPSAAGFIDPLLSTGFPLALLGVIRIAALLKDRLDGGAFASGLQNYEEATSKEFIQTASLISALYANMHNFEIFRTLTLLYFAAASFSETVRRLGRPERAQSFLLHDDPRFGPACRELFAWATRGIAANEMDVFIRKVRKTIEPFDVAGLAKENRQHCYPVDANDVLDSAGKVGASREEITAMLARSGFYAEVNT